MDDILEEASDVVQCKECPWYKTCVMPMKFTAEDIEKEIRLAQVQPTTNNIAGYDVTNLMASAACAMQDRLLEGCPIFVHRLKTSPKLAEQIKKMMQTWGTEE